MEGKKTEIRAQRNIHGRCIEISLMEYEGQSPKIGAVEMREIPEKEFGQWWAKPTLALSYELATMLMDELWHEGIRPTNEVGTVGELSATRNHLNDMRRIVGKKLDVEFK